MYQDSAGTTPVTGIEQPVGRILDRSGRGNHATQSTSSARPVLAARVNLATYTEDFSNSAWRKTNATITTDQTTAPDGTSTADLLVSNTTNAAHYLDRDPTNGTITITNGFAYTFSICLKKGSGSTAPNIVQMGVTTLAFAAGNYANFNISNGTVGTTSGLTASITSLGSGWYRCTVAATASGTTSTTGAFYVGFTNNNDGLGRLPSYADATTSDVFVWGFDARQTNQGVNLPAYQRVAASTDYDSAGFPLYLRFDGVDDVLSTGSINLSGTNNLTLFNSARKVSDVTVPGIMVEFSTNSALNNGTFINSVSGIAGNEGDLFYRIAGNASSYAQYAATPAAPVTFVSTLIGDLSQATVAAQTTARYNGSAVTLTYSGTAGTGNFGNYPIYIGARAGTGSFFVGNLYGLIVRGASTSTPQLTATENWLRLRSRAY